MTRKRKKTIEPPPAKSHLKSYHCISCHRKHSAWSKIGKEHRKFAEPPRLIGK